MEGVTKGFFPRRSEVTRVTRVTKYQMWTESTQAEDMFTYLENVNMWNIVQTIFLSLRATLIGGGKGKVWMTS